MVEIRSTFAHMLRNYTCQPPPAWLCNCPMNSPLGPCMMTSLSPPWLRSVTVLCALIRDSLGTASALGHCRRAQRTYIISGLYTPTLKAWQSGGKKEPSQVACFSEDLKCWEAWDNYLWAQSQGHITPASIAWRREAWKEEALDDLPWKDERGPSSVRRTLEPFQTQRWGNFRETGWERIIMGFSERTDTILKWTEVHAQTRPSRREPITAAGRHHGMNQHRLDWPDQ